MRGWGIGGVDFTAAKRSSKTHSKFRLRKMEPVNN
jgi:hypothetical protein